MTLSCGCTKELQPENSTSDDKAPALSTKADSQFHWICTRCGSLNSPWWEKCLGCGGSFNEYHGYLVNTFINMVRTQIQTTLPGGMGDPDAGSIQLPDRTWTITVPTEWYESTAVVNYYNSKLSSILLLPEYREGFQCAWYRSVRSLYPGKHNESNVESQFDLWKLNYGSNLRSLGQYGIGIIEGSEAAVTAFVDYR